MLRVELGGVVAASLINDRLLHLGAQLLEVPISAMLVLAVGGAQGRALDRVYETLIRAGVGVVVNLVIAAPLYVQPASDALGELAERMAAFLRQLADQLGEGWCIAQACEALPRLRTGLTGLEHTHLTIRNLCRSLRDRTYFVPANRRRPCTTVRCCRRRMPSNTCPR